MADANIVVEVDSGVELVARQVTAHEQLGRPFQLDVIAMSTLPTTAFAAGADDVGPRVDIDAIVGRRAAVRVVQREATHRVWSGIVSHVEQVRWDPTPGSESTYHLRVVPTSWLLGQRRGNRIFQHVTIPDVLKKLLEQEWKLEVEWRFDAASYPKKEYVVQYDETDVDFAHRLLEEAGLLYFFGEVGGGEAKTKIVVTDKAHTFGASMDLPFTDSPNEVHNPLYATNVTLAHNVRPGRFQISDFNFRRPGQPLFGTSDPAPGAEGSREIYVYEPGGFLTETGGPGKGPSDEKVADDKSTTVHDADELGKARAQRFLEAERHKKRYVAFETSAQNLVPGKVFTISDHPNPELSAERLLAIQSMTRVTATGEWTVVVEGVFTDTPYRLPRTTTKPRVRGVQSAIVVGPKGDEIHTDEFGRVRVKLHWDREGQFDDDSTCWLRVSQAWAGAQYGMTMIPRVGHEVIVDFLDGDPDQPLVVGRVYTHPSPAPYKLPDHATRTTWQTNTTPDQKGDKCFNEIMFEDKKGEELVLLQAERNMMSLTKRDHTERTGERRSHVVGKDWVHVVGGIDATHVGEQHLVQMVSPSDLAILEKRDPSYAKRPTFIEMKDEKITLTTGKADIVLDGPDITVQAKKGIRMSADGKLIIAGGPMVFINAMGSAKVDPSAFWKIKDEIGEPEGDVLNSIIQLFHEKWLAKKRQSEGERKIRAQVEADVTKVPALTDKDAKDGGVTAKALTGQPFVDGPQPDDVKQGSLGDCYLMAAMAAVAHARPDVIEGVMAETMEGKVNVGFDGGQTPVVVDTSVPHQGASPRYAKADGGETWSALMEKAYADAYGSDSYQGIWGGWPSDAMGHITGAPSQAPYGVKPAMLADPAKRKALLDVLPDAPNTPTAAVTQMDEGWLKGNRVVGQHAYTVLGTKKGPKGEDIVQLRNPWGSGGKNGDRFEMTLDEFAQDFWRVDRAGVPPKGGG